LSQGNEYLGYSFSRDAKTWGRGLRVGLPGCGSKPKGCIAEKLPPRMIENAKTMAEVRDIVFPVFLQIQANYRTCFGNCLISLIYHFARRKLTGQCSMRIA
jgi:hypothetical protein